MHRSTARSTFVRPIAFASLALAAASASVLAGAQEDPPITFGGASGGGGQLDGLPQGVTLLGVVSFGPAAAESGFAFARYEESEGVDLNGDGDTEDRVAGRYTTANGAIANDAVALAELEYIGYYGRGTQFTGIDSGGDTLVMTVGEEEQGNADLNGDGDADDFQYLVRNAATGAVVSDQFQRTATICISEYGTYCGELYDVDGDWVALQAAENGSADHNLDGDMDDNVHVLVNGSTGQVINTLLAGFPGYPAGSRPCVGNGLALLPVHEQDNGGADLNGDGDGDDYVFGILELATGRLQFQDGWPFQYRAEDIVSYPGGFAMVLNEFAAVQDYNGDGDQYDHVLHTYDHASGTTYNTGYAVDSILETVVGNKLRVRLKERDQGQDLNGNGTTTDLVLGLLDVTTSQVLNTGLSVLAYFKRDLGADGDYAVAIASEGASLLGDQNGDGDTLDGVPVLFDGDNLTATVLPVAVGLPSYVSDYSILEDGILALPVSEAGQGATDLTGDGDTDDVTLFVLDLETLQNVQVPDAISEWVDVLVDDGFVYYSVDEDASGRDLNYDGDTTDHVWHALDRNTFRTKNLAIDHYTGAIAFDGRLVTGLSEYYLEADLNHDGDQSDTILSFVDASRF